MFAAAAVGAALALAASFLVTPRYRGESVVIIDNGEAGGGLGSMLGELGNFASLAGVNLGASGAGTDEAIAYLQSRELGTRFIREQEISDALLDSRFLHGRLPWSKPSNEEQKIREAYRYFDRHVRAVRTDRKAGVTRILMDWPDSEVAAQWANSYVALADSALREKTLENYKLRRNFLEKELVRTDQVELRSAIAKLLDGQLRMEMVANSRGEFALKVVDPAVPALLGDRVSPRRVVYLTFGALAGMTIAGFWVLLRGTKRM